MGNYITYRELFDIICLIVSIATLCFTYFSYKNTKK